MKRAILNVAVIAGLIGFRDPVGQWLTEVIYDSQIQSWLGLLAACVIGGLIQGCLFPNRPGYKSPDAFWTSILAWLGVGIVALFLLNQVGLRAMTPKLPPPEDEWTAIFTSALWVVVALLTGVTAHQLRTRWHRRKAALPFVG